MINNGFPCIVDMDCDHPCEEFFATGICPCTLRSGVSPVNEFETFSTDDEEYF